MQTQCPRFVQALSAAVAALSLLHVTALAPAIAETPGERWSTATPAEAGLDEKQLARARDYALTGNGSGCIVRGGKLVMSWGDLKRRYDLKSTTKSFGSAALGLAIADGKVRLNDRAATHHPNFGIPLESNARTGWLDKITIAQLASQTAGWDKNGGYVELLFEPGTEWAYSDSGPNWLAECITLACRRDLNELMFERLFTPLGVRPADLVWRKNSYRPEQISGIMRREFGSGISANVDAMARFGLLWLRGGDWNGAQLLPGDFIRLASQTIPGGEALPVRKPEEYGKASHHYGLLWWNNADGAIESVPRDAYWSWGLHDSLIVVMPSLDLLVARAGKGWKREPDADHYKVLEPFLQPVAAAAGFDPESAPPPGDALALRPGPYPPSSVIKGIEWAPAAAVLRLAKGSDNWPLTWADDGALYSAYGDGRGFEPFVPNKLSLGLASITGTPPSIKGVNIRSESAETLGDGARGRKASGILCVDGVLYLLVRNAGLSHLGWSSDHGATWTWADWKFTEGFGCPTFLNFGKDYAGARDHFVYVYSPDSESAYERADRFILARAPRAQMADRESWQFFAGLDPSGDPAWTPEISRRGSVFSNPGGCYRSGITYNAPLRRYLWCQTGLGEDTRFRGGFAIYDAPEPWGPWTTVFHTADWDIGPGESSSLPAKWMSPDGRTVRLVFSGDDAFSVRQGTLTIASDSSPQ
ncbi:MAG TPA: serine hydrolase [Verrucomicrobiales bacterium]|nr:serine hydrolase [Verrucomicrobiales bacterium]